MLVRSRAPIAALAVLTLALMFLPLVPFASGAEKQQLLPRAALEEDLGIDRVGSTDRIGTAVKLARSVYRSGAPTAVIARADEYSDALTGTTLAAERGGPLLLTQSGKLDARVQQELKRLDVDYVVLLGGEAALSRTVASAVARQGLEVQRLGGRDRFETAEIVADAVAEGEHEHAYLVEGRNGDPARGWVDAVAVSALAATRGHPIILTDRDDLPESAARVLSTTSEVTLVGGPVAISQAVEARVVQIAGAASRIAGADRYETSLAVAQAQLELNGSVEQAWLATGRDFPDALATGAAAAASNGMLLLIDGQSVNGESPATEWLASRAGTLRQLTYVGGEMAISKLSVRNGGQRIREARGQFRLERDEEGGGPKVGGTERDHEEPLVGSGGEPSPRAPTDFQAAAGEDDITVSWSPDPQGPVDEYRVYRQVTHEDIDLRKVTAETSYLDTDVSPGTTYRYLVTGVVDGHEGYASGPVVAILEGTTSEAGNPQSGERLGLFVADAELEVWRERAAAGPYRTIGDVSSNSPGDWQRISANAASFEADPPAVWDADSGGDRYDPRGRHGSRNGAYPPRDDEGHTPNPALTCAHHLRNSGRRVVDIQLTGDLGDVPAGRLDRRDGLGLELACELPAGTATR